MLGLVARARAGSEHDSVHAIKPSSFKSHGCLPIVPRSWQVLIASSASEATIVLLSLASFQKSVGFFTLNSSNSRCWFSLCAWQCAQ